MESTNIVPSSSPSKLHCSNATTSTANVVETSSILLPNESSSSQKIEVLVVGSQQQDADDAIMLERKRQRCASDPNECNQKIEEFVDSQQDADAIMLVRKRQRLVELGHAYLCPSGPNECTISPHCGKLKILLEHLYGCKNDECATRYCLTSRFILTHYRNCRDQSCEDCSAVRPPLLKRSTSMLINNCDSDSEETIPLPPSSFEDDNISVSSSETISLS
jgi:hypothetical protein